VPEGHTLHRLARLHQKRYTGAPVEVTSPQGRFAGGASAVSGRVMRRASAWGKHLFHDYEGGLIIHVHLGLYGTFTEWPMPMPAPVGQVRMRMKGNEYGTDLRGPTACEVINRSEVDEIIARLGPDPLRRNPDTAKAWKRISNSRRPIGALFMDQAVIAGVGNVYRNELLYRHLIDPHRPGTHVSEAEFGEAWTDLVKLMKIGVSRGKILTVRRTHDKGSPSYRPGRPRTYVYRRAGEPCRVCGTPIRTEVMEGRNLFWCPTCQT
jgi:endonuclease VIII